MIPERNTYARSVAAQRRWQKEVANESLGIQEVAALLNPRHPDVARVSQLIESGEILAVPYEGSFRFRAYQFRGTTVSPAIPVLLELAKRNGIPPWDVALWMISPTSLFAAQDRPADHLRDPEQLLAAAHIAFEVVW